MLATFVIGLREGLEAALIVGIIAAFLRRNGRPLLGMWVGVISAVLLSIGVGVALAAIEQALPQAAQEGMESIIGAVAVVFVTGMIVWMNRHARGMKRELEGEASAALRSGQASALVVMAFLAVLKEGFETSVFLLATFSAAQDTLLAAVGAVLGIAVAVGIGIGIYVGGVRIDLGRFFRITGAFLILVAAGLVMSTLRTAHEAGWLLAGQQRTLDLSGIVTPGSVTSALITGVLGIPADPRLIEIVGWFAYLVPVVLYVYWPRQRRLQARAARRLQRGIAIGCVVAAAALAIGFAIPRAAPTPALPLVEGSAPSSPSATEAPATLGTVSLDHDDLLVSPSDSPTQRIRLGSPAPAADHGGWTANERTWTTTPALDPPASLTLGELAALNGGRLPIGVNRAQQPGPFAAQWRVTDSGSAWVADGALIDASLTRSAVVTLSGGGLTTARSVTLTSTDPAHADAGWRVADAAVAAQVEHLAGAATFAEERQLWGVQIPLVLVITALVLVFAAERSRRRAARDRRSPENPPPEPLVVSDRRNIDAH